MITLRAESDVTRDQVHRLLEPFVAKRAERAKRHDADAEECQARGEGGERPTDRCPVAGGRVRGPEERHQQPDDEADHEGVVELASAHDLADLLHDNRAQAIAGLVEPAEQRGDAGRRRGTGSG